MRPTIILTSLWLAASLHAEATLPGGWVLESMQTLGTPQGEGNVIGCPLGKRGVLFGGQTGASPRPGGVFVARFNSDETEPTWTTQFPMQDGGSLQAISRHWWGGIRVATRVQPDEIDSVKRLDKRGREVWSVELPNQEMVLGLSQGGWGCTTVLTSTIPSPRQFYLRKLNASGREVRKQQIDFGFETGLIAQSHALTPKGSHLFGLRYDNRRGSYHTAAAMCDADGRVNWTWKADPPSNAIPKDVACDEQGRSYVAGNGLVFVLSTDGKELARRKITDESRFVSIWQIVPRPGGGAYVVTTLSGAPGKLTIFTLDANHTVTGHTILDPNSSVFVDSAWVDDCHRLVLTGTFKATLFGKGPTGEGTKRHSDPFIVRLRPPVESHQGR